MIAIKDLCKTYRGPNGDVHALKDVALDVAPGEFVAVQGPSGCGKTTLLLATGGLLLPTSGEAIVCDQDPYALSPNGRARWRAATVGFVFQQFHLVPYLNVLDNVLASAIALPAPDAPERAAELIERFGLADRAQHVPAELSTGERQRVALARALLNRPKVLLADEPTGNLDEANSELVLSRLSQFAESGGTVLLVTHASDAASAAHRVIRIEAGRLATV